MNANVESFLLQLKSVNQDLPGLVHGLSDQQFNWQPGAERWSIGQNVEHLNITAERYIPVLTKAIRDGRTRGTSAPGPFALGFFERWFVGAMEPPPKRRIRTRPAFVPPSNLPTDATLQRFLSLQEQLADCMRAADGVDLARIKVRSQFGPISWSLNGTFTFLLAHQRRHVWQARQVRNEAAFPGSAHVA